VSGLIIFKDKLKMISTIKNNIAARKVDGGDRADIVQTVLLIAGFAVVAILVVTWIGSSVLNKGADTANCVETADSYASASNAANACKAGAGSNNATFKSDAGYSSRY
jgi:hypothetical protein